MVFLDNVLLLTVGIILGLAVVGAVLRARRRDICLKSFSRYLVYVRLKSGKQIWGELVTDATGVELVYRADHEDLKGHIESSYIIPNAEFPNIYMIIRFLDELTEKNALRREVTLRRSYKPNLIRRIKRKIRNWFNLLRDAMSQAFASVLTAATKTGPTAVASQQKGMVGTGKELVEWFGNAYDPILERQIGKRIVLEVASPDGEILEFVGVFREYSSDYLEVMDVTFEDEGRKRLVDLVVPRKHGTVRHNSETTGHKKVESEEEQPAILDDPTSPETQVEV
jgi:hypothetical protein